MATNKLQGIALKVFLVLVVLTIFNGWNGCFGFAQEGFPEDRAASSPADAPAEQRSAPP